MGGLLSYLFGSEENKNDTGIATFSQPQRGLTGIHSEAKNVHSFERVNPYNSWFDSSVDLYDTSYRRQTPTYSSKIDSSVGQYDTSYRRQTPTYPSKIDIKKQAGYKGLLPSEISYTQGTISSTFYENGRHAGVKIGVTLDDLLTNRIQIKDIPQIRVCWYKQRWFSLDNRRLWVLKKYEEIKGNLRINVKVIPSMDEDKFTTTSNGMRVNVRGDPGGIYWKSYR